MENKNTLLIIIAVLIIALVGMFVFLNLPSAEQQEVEQNNQEEQSEASQQNQTIEEDWSHLPQEVQQALEIRQTTEVIGGVLVEVGDTYLVIEQSVPEENQEMTNPEEMKYIQERIKVKVTSATELFDLSDIKHITVPSNITGIISTLEYLLTQSADYIIQIYIAAGAPVVNGEIETNYIEWSSWPVGGF